jgi:ADP-heptose:LPS heptosyltransferase
MNVSAMKKIDRYAGIPICLVLDAFSRLRALFPVRRVGTPRKILVMKFFGMGSVLLASPMLAGLRATYPSAELAFLTFASNRDLVERLGAVDRVYFLRTGSFIQFAGDLLRALGSIRRERYDVTIDMEFFSKFSTIVAYLSGSPIRIGYYLRQLWRGDLLTHQVYYNQHKHITEVFGALVAPLGVDVARGRLARPAVRAEEPAAAARLLSSVGVLPGERTVCFNVNASDMSFERRWPMREFVALANAMLDELDVKLLFIGAPSDVAYVAEVVARLDRPDRVLNLAGRTTLGELLCILRDSVLLVSNDSGPLHLAASLGVPTVSFFGPETPTLYSPVGNDSLVFYGGLYCSPCLNVFNVKTAPCKGENACMQGIRADVVLDATRIRFGHLWRTHGRDSRPRDADGVAANGEAGTRPDPSCGGSVA